MQERIGLGTKEHMFLGKSCGGPYKGGDDRNCSLVVWLREKPNTGLNVKSGSIGTWKVVRLKRVETD